MSLFRRNAGVSQIMLPAEKLQEIIDEGELVCSSVVADPVSHSRRERRIVRYASKFHLVQILHEAVHEPTGKWLASTTVSGFGATETLDQKPDENDSFFCWQNIRPETKFLGKFKPPVIEWATTSLDQCKKDERQQVENWKKRSR